ncbi:MAG: nucleoside triphosphate pyrophosphohydrolase [Candidatus Bathyarchaeota archaeon]|nr:nucleoside triphosphate pyrophosphohydrolase [Candidatus Termiticorpusculum sp.]
MKEYNKLVRDKVPQIIKQDNRIPVTRVLSDSDYLDELNKKLREELEEYLIDGNIEEIADILEVILGILEVKGVQYDEIDKIRIQKVLDRGAFNQRIFLEKVLDKDEL